VNVSEFTESNSSFLKKEDIGDRRVKVIISRVGVTTFDDSSKKLVLHFQGKEKGVALNRTNTQVLAGAFGQESDGWLGQQVELWVDPYVTFGGKMVGGLKITPIRSAPIPQAPPPVAPAAPFDDDIPF
jgi:hypothetical protein